MKSNKLRRVLAIPFWLGAISCIAFFQIINFLTLIVVGLCIMAPMEWMYETVAGIHYCDGQFQNWPKKYCKLCHYPQNPLGKYPEDESLPA